MLNFPKEFSLKSDAENVNYFEKIETLEIINY